MTHPAQANTQQITFALKGMFSAKCTGEIERALVQLDGVVAAHVNYATERATVVYDPAQATALKMVSAVRSIGYDTPVERRELYADKLLYASSRHTAERMLGRAKGIVRVRAELESGILDLVVLPGRGLDDEWARSLRRTKFHATPKSHDHARVAFLLRTTLFVAVEILMLWSAGAHAGWFVSPRLLHLPIVAAIIALFVQFGAGYPFYQFAYDAALGGEFDLGVMVALQSSALALVSLPVALLSPSPWLTDIGFIAATSLTTGWFLARSLQFWIIPLLRDNLLTPNHVSTSRS